MYSVTKTYTPETGLSATFRQWRATSHCRFLHGYALGVEVTWCCEEEDLDENGWVLNFGGLKAFKSWLEATFDHKTLVAKDDPALPVFRGLASAQIARPLYQDNGSIIEPIIQLVEVERTGCEAFARMIADWLLAEMDQFVGQRAVLLKSVRVFEHGGNSATYEVD